MRTLFTIICLGLLLSCSSVSNKNITEKSESGKIYFPIIDTFSDISDEIVSNLDKMGTDNTEILNVYEGEYFNYIFDNSPQIFNLAGKKVGFIRDKMDYFKQTRSLYNQGSSIVGGNSLYIFNDAQKEESGGYDAAIVYWSKFVIPTRTVVKRLHKRKVATR